MRWQLAAGVCSSVILAGVLMPPVLFAQAETPAFLPEGNVTVKGFIPDLTSARITSGTLSLVSKPLDPSGAQARTTTNAQTPAAGSPPKQSALRAEKQSAVRTEKNAQVVRKPVRVPQAAAASKPLVIPHKSSAAVTRSEQKPLKLDAKAASSKIVAAKKPVAPAKSSVTKTSISVKKEIQTGSASRALQSASSRTATARSLKNDKLVSFTGKVKSVSGPRDGSIRIAVSTGSGTIQALVPDTAAVRALKGGTSVKFRGYYTGISGYDPVVDVVQIEHSSAVASARSSVRSSVRTSAAAESSRKVARKRVCHEPRFSPIPPEFEREMGMDRMIAAPPPMAW